MTELPDRAARAFEAHDAFARVDDEWFELTTTRFQTRITVEETDDWPLIYTLEIRAPMLSAATEDDVGDAVETGWFETYDRRLEDAPMAVRSDVDVTKYRVFEEGGDAVAVFGFEEANADRAPEIAKAIGEFAEGTYVQGIVPGYHYEPPVSDLLSRARQTGGEGDGDGDRGPMPL